MDHAEQTMKVIKIMYGKDKGEDDITIYEGKNSVLRIRNAVARTSIEEFIVDDEAKVLIMRVRMGLHSLRKYREQCRSYMDEVMRMLQKDGHYVELKMERNGDVYFQCTQSMKGRTASLPDIRRMYDDLLMAEGEYGLRLQMAMIGMSPWKLECKEIMDEEENLIMEEISEDLDKYETEKKIQREKEVGSSEDWWFAGEENKKNEELTMEQYAEFFKGLKNFEGL